MTGKKVVPVRIEVNTSPGSLPAPLIAYRMIAYEAAEIALLFVNRGDDICPGTAYILDPEAIKIA
jgi:hypothetical protein